MMKHHPLPAIWMNGKTAGDVPDLSLG